MAINDLNSYVNVGIYAYNGWDSTLLNKPVLNRWGTLIVTKAGINFIQSLVDETGRLYSRRADDTGWTPWYSNGVAV